MVLAQEYWNGIPYPILSIYGIYGQLKADVDMRAGNPQIGIPGTGNNFIDGIIGGYENKINNHLEKLKLIKAY